MVVLDSSYIKALGVKSPGLKQCFFIFHDTLLWSCCWKIDGAGIFFTESKVCFRIQIWSYDSLSETITFIVFNSSISSDEINNVKNLVYKNPSVPVQWRFSSSIHAMSWFRLSRSLLYNIWNATALLLDISTHNEK